MSKGGDAPTPPDAAKTIAAQTASNLNTAQNTQAMNLIDSSTPLGSIKYTPTPGANGDPTRWSSTVSLTPEGQQTFDQNQALANALSQLSLQGVSRVSDAMAKPAGYDNLTAIPNDPDGSKAADAIYAQNTSRLDPQYAKSDAAMEDKLINSGLSKGTTAYNSAWESYNRSKNDAYTSARNASVIGGQQSADDQLANALKSRQQQISEQNYQRELPLNEVTALESGGQVQMPSFAAPAPVSVAGTNTAGITQDAYANQAAVYNQQQQQQSALYGDLFGLAGSAVGGWAFGGFK